MCSTSSQWDSCWMTHGNAVIKWQYFLQWLRDLRRINHQYQYPNSPLHAWRGSRRTNKPCSMERYFGRVGCEIPKIQTANTPTPLSMHEEVQGGLTNHAPWSVILAELVVKYQKYKLPIPQLPSPRMKRFKED